MNIVHARIHIKKRIHILSSKNPEITFDVSGAYVVLYNCGVRSYARWSYQGNETGNKLLVKQ